VQGEKNPAGEKGATKFEGCTARGGGRGDGGRTTLLLFFHASRTVVSVTTRPANTSEGAGEKMGCNENLLDGSPNPPPSPLTHPRKKSEGIGSGVVPLCKNMRFFCRLKRRGKRGIYVLEQ